MPTVPPALIAAPDGLASALRGTTVPQPTPAPSPTCVTVHAGAQRKEPSAWQQPLARRAHVWRRWLLLVGGCTAIGLGIGAWSLFAWNRGPSTRAVRLPITEAKVGAVATPPLQANTKPGIAKHVDTPVQAGTNADITTHVQMLQARLPNNASRPPTRWESWGRKPRKHRPLSARGVPTKTETCVTRRWQRSKRSLPSCNRTSSL
jgi:hypothetical protein